jgi:hypothetical protein
MRRSVPKELSKACVDDLRPVLIRVSWVVIQDVARGSARQVLVLAFIVIQRMKARVRDAPKTAPLAVFILAVLDPSKLLTGSNRHRMWDIAAKS